MRPWRDDSPVNTNECFPSFPSGAAVLGGAGNYLSNHGYNLLTGRTSKLGEQVTLTVAQVEPTKSDAICGRPSESSPLVLAAKCGSTSPFSAKLRALQVDLCGVNIPPPSGYRESAQTSQLRRKTTRHRAGQKGVLGCSASIVSRL